MPVPAAHPPRRQTADGDVVAERPGLFLKIVGTPGGLPSASWTLPKGVPRPRPHQTTVIVTVPRCSLGRGRPAALLIDTGVFEPHGKALTSF